MLSPDELKRVFSRLGPAARETPTVETLRGFFHAEAAGRGATRSLSEAEIRWVMAAVHALLEDEDVTIGDAIRAANRAAQRREEPVTGQRRWILVAKEWLDFESVPLDDFVATLDESGEPRGYEVPGDAEGRGDAEGLGDAEGRGDAGRARGVAATPRRRAGTRRRRRAGRASARRRRI